MKPTSYLIEPRWAFRVHSSCREFRIPWAHTFVWTLQPVCHIHIRNDTLRPLGNISVFNGIINKNLIWPVSSVGGYNKCWKHNISNRYAFSLSLQRERTLPITQSESWLCCTVHLIYITLPLAYASIYLLGHNILLAHLYQMCMLLLLVYGGKVCEGNVRSHWKCVNDVANICYYTYGSRFRHHRKCIDGSY